MLPLPPHRISEAIIHLFRRRAEWSVEEMDIRLKKEGFLCSKRGLFKELRQLIEQGVLVRTKRRYSLSLTWMLSLRRFADDLFDTSLQHLPFDILLPTEGKKTSWVFYDLRQLDQFWLQMIFLLFERSAERCMYAWIPIFWFDVIHLEKDLEAQSAMKKAGNTMRMLLGGETYIERLPTRYWDARVYSWTYAPEAFTEFGSQYFDVIGDFILFVNLPDRVLSDIQNIFKKIQGKRDLVYLREFDALRISGPCRVRLEKNAKKAAKLRDALREYLD
jgi:hypothetical protein